MEVQVTVKSKFIQSIFHIILIKSWKIFIQDSINLMALSLISNFVYIHSERETATTALMEGGGPRGPGRGGPSGNGFFNNNCNNLAAAAHVAAHNGGDRSRLFRKSNGSKPVREWYV